MRRERERERDLEPLQPRSPRGAVEWFLPKPAIWLDVSRFSIREGLSHQFECIRTPASKGVHHTGASWPDAWLGVHEATDVLTIPGNREVKAQRNE